MPVAVSAIRSVGAFRHRNPPAPALPADPAPDSRALGVWRGGSADVAARRWVENGTDLARGYQAHPAIGAPHPSVRRCGAGHERGISLPSDTSFARARSSNEAT